MSVRANSRAATGEAAESLARRRLEAAGLRFRQANFRARRGEIDLVMETPDGQIVFVEVRYRSRPDYGGGVASVDARKRQRLIHAARAWLHCHGLDQRPARFDVVAVDRHDRIQWIEAAFDADGAG
ncbi:MAG: YraN family protein [Halofilum sp. (in: g-proteobacteria)]